MLGKDIADVFPSKRELDTDADEWINPSDSVAISKRALDVTGHYSRPDMFHYRLTLKL